MNERIRELAEKAGMTEGRFERYKGQDCNLKGYSMLPDEMEKFAELIVRECLDIALEVRGEPATDTHYVIGYDRACEKMISGIREHFGVEE